MAEEDVYARAAQAAREAAALTMLRGVKPPGTVTRPPGKDQGSAEKLFQAASDFIIPQSALDVGMMVAGGPIGGKVLRTLAPAIGAMLSPEEAQAKFRAAMSGAQKLLAGAETAPGAISTRFPTAASAPKDPLTTYMQPNMAALRGDPELHDPMMRLVASYPGMPRGLARSKDISEIEDIVGNFLRGNYAAIYEAQPDIVRRLGSKWYEGANRIATERAKQYDLPVPSVAANYASLSPQMDWFKNVSLGDRVLDIMANQQRKTFDDAMAQTARNYNTPLPREEVNALRGKQLRSLEPDDQARFVRAYDETYNPRGYQIVSPTGEFLGPKLDLKGMPADVGWGSYKQIESAIRALHSGGDAQLIASEVLGPAHKVRSFYNNILFPNAPMGDVTSDTHNVAAALFRPLSGKHPEVLHNLSSGGPAGAINAPTSAISGIYGTYPVYVDPLQQVAVRYGVLPREMQSVTWEGIRGLFSPTFKRSDEADKIEQIWRKLGVDRAEEARQAITRLSGGYRLPDWVPLVQ